MATRLFNPISASRVIEKSYRDYIASTIHFEDRQLQSQLQDILESRNYLAKGPFLEATPPYSKDLTVRQLVKEGVLCNSMLNITGLDVDRRLYVHQVNAIRKAVEGKNYIVATGTGSGKTECFLLPIINDILKEFEETGPKAGVRAMILYPMNALANDQLKRLRELLKGVDITFGRYTGDTQETEGEALKAWLDENPGEEKLPNEIISREQIRKAPPNILLTNYSMLEYILLRPQDAPLFEGTFGSSWRHIAIDEAHVYSGALGTEIAYLLRRLKARVRYDAGETPKLHCYATSATIGSPKDMPKVAKFAQDIFGEPFDQGEDAPSVIKSIQDLPESDLSPETWGSLGMETWIGLRRALLDHADGSTVREVLATSVPKAQLEKFDSFKNPHEGLGAILLGEEATKALVKAMSNALIDLTSLEAIDRLGIRGLKSDDNGIENLTAMVEVLSVAQRSEDVPILSSRYHSFLRAPEGLYINLLEKSLMAEKTVGKEREDGSIVPIYEVSVCRHCGQAYILGHEQNNKSYAWLNPRHAGTDADDDFLPRNYYRIAYDGLVDIDEDAKGSDAGREMEWLCPACGTLHNSKEGGTHRFEHEVVERIPLEPGTATEEDSRCTHCGYRNRFAIQPMRVSPEAVGSVVCYELARLVPAFEDKEISTDDLFGGLGELPMEERAGSVICFSDRRQDAAFFAPTMERTSTKITVRQLIREAIEALTGGAGECAPSDVVRWISSTGFKKHQLRVEDVNSPLARKDQAWAWMIDELEAEDGRNSLEGLGIIRVEPSLMLKYLGSVFATAVSGTILRLPGDIRAWMDPNGYVKLLRICLDTLRERGALDVPQGADALRTNRAKPRLVTKGDEGASAPGKEILFVGLASRTENKRSKIVRAYANRVHGINLDREQAGCILRNMFKFILDMLKAIEKQEGCALVRQEGNGFFLSPDFWSLSCGKPSDEVFVCDTCGCEFHYDTDGVCLSNNCDGHLERTTFAELKEKDEYYKNLYIQKPVPLRIEEHTAQLSSERARAIQKKFIKGEVNVLSCTTTFELGVDVGDLRSVFMRNMPPSTANYTQRAGRTGRRAGMPGYAITFARLRPHDIAFFKHPESMIKGTTRAPICYLDNDIIAVRHVFAIALSQYFRYVYATRGVNYSQRFHEFLDLRQNRPEGLSLLKKWLDDRPEAVGNQIDDVFASSPKAAKRLDIENWNWIDDLLNVENGRLTKAHLLKHSSYCRLENGVQANRESNLGYAQALERQQYGMEKEGTINVLAENGVLPKYGFPTDLVELSLPDQDNSSRTNDLELQRGLRLAIREYAPGSEIVAGKKLWCSTGIKRLRGREFESRSFGRCPQCDNFVWSVETGDIDEKCPVCGSSITLSERMLVPSSGFTGEMVAKGIGLQRPRSKGSTKVYFSQRWPNEFKTGEIVYSGGIIHTKYAGNAALCILNRGEGGRGFNTCMSCGAASTGRVNHRRFCQERNTHRFNALGTSFISDVLEMSFELAPNACFDREDWESLLWAIFSAASAILEISESEIGGTLYKNKNDMMSIMLYDDVPGGAGHVLHLSDLGDSLLKRAYKIVSTCTCDENTCCYGCLCNYYNQPIQHRISRGGAMRIIESLFT